MTARTSDPAKRPSVYQVNTRAFLHDRGVDLGRPATLDDVPDALLDGAAEQGFAWIWFLGVWQTGEEARQISRADGKLRAEVQRALPDLRDADVVGSPFAIAAWTVHRDFGGDAALERLRTRMRRRGLSLLLDFVPNHVAPDHPWVRDHPERFIAGSEEDLAREPQNYRRVVTKRGPMILAYGRDPSFDGWSDTLQLNFRHGGLRQAQVAVLTSLAERCDGVRCDMAMLVEPDVIARTWGDRARPADGTPPEDDSFWPIAMAAARKRHPGFVFVAEVYWDLEWRLQREGFDYTYDKRLYDRLRAQDAGAVRGHLTAEASYQERSLRFLENHDEARAAATFDWSVHKAAAVITFFVPGMRLFHEGQLEGRRVHLSMHVGRRPFEATVPEVQAFYERLMVALKHPAVHDGHWTLQQTRAAWASNPTYAQIIGMTWELGADRLFIASNYGATQAQGYVSLPLDGLEGRTFVLRDLLSDVSYERRGDDLAARGLYLDVPAWGYHVFELVAA